MRFGRQLCGDLDEASAREWLVADGAGGFAMGTASGLRTRRYHALLVVAESPARRRVALTALDPVLVVGDTRIRLAVHEWSDGSVDPRGNVHLASFDLSDGVPRWRWQIGDVLLERELAMEHGRPAVSVVHRLVRAAGPVRLELAALGTWRDAHGERFAGNAPAVEAVADGYVFEGAYRVAGPGFAPGGEWYVGVRHREEASRGLADHEDLWCAGTFAHELEPGGTLVVSAWAGDLAAPPPPGTVARARARARSLTAGAHDGVDAQLLLAADQFVVGGPTVVAGYPWFGDWSRDTMTSYEGLFLETGRVDEGRRLLERNASTLDEGMLANTADTGTLEYNTVDGTLWFLHAVGRHVERTGDVDLAAQLAPQLRSVVEWHVRGTRYGIAVDPADGLLTQGGDGVALTWMDARVDGVPVTQRAGKAVEVNALWVNGLAVVARLTDDADVAALETRARASFGPAFALDGRCADVVGDARLRPNQLLAVSLPYAPLDSRSVVRSCAPLVTSIGLRSLDPSDGGYIGRHRGDGPSRDRAYHQGTVWPWLVGPYAEAAQKVGEPTERLLDGLETHLSEWGLGSVSETADGDAPHAATGCPFQAWSVAETLRARRLLLR